VTAAPRLATTVLAATALLGVAAPTAGSASGAPARLPAETVDVNHLPPVSSSDLARSVRTWDLRGSVCTWDLKDSVRELEQTGTDGPETVVSLNSDILFAFGKATLSQAATTRIRALVARVPRRSALAVGGHTDDLGADAANLALSRRRAEAVAAAVRAARPDLRLTVKGYGEARPVAPNSSGGRDDPEGRAKNRRVELRYRG
jgi:outer membrane protein OmpA-like peptidoglycan-associated protein